MTGRILIAAAAIALFACAQKVEGAPEYPLDQCRRVTLVDAGDGQAVVGAEDLAYDAATRRIVISAYDRRATERAARNGASALPQGGVYVAAIDALASAPRSLTLASIVPRDLVAGGLRPHGVSFDAARREITFVNRAYEKVAGRWRMKPTIERVGADGAAFIGDGGAPRCSANDVATFGGRTVVSFDHASCGWRGGLEELLDLRVSGVDASDGVELFHGARHANGLVALDDTGIALAATRDRAIFLLTNKDGALTAKRKIPVPGAPDNLSVSDDGAIVAAVYPSMIAIGAQRKLGLGRSGSRVVRIDPSSGVETLLFEDPKAELFSAASAAIEAEGALVIGSALDRGLVVCGKATLTP